MLSIGDVTASVKIHYDVIKRGQKRGHFYPSVAQGREYTQMKDNLLLNPDLIPFLGFVVAMLRYLTMI